jgi:hypothetical protein
MVINTGVEKIKSKKYIGGYCIVGILHKPGLCQVDDACPIVGYRSRFRNNLLKLLC